MQDITIGFYLENLWPHSHRGVDDRKPKGNQRHKIVKLIWPVHDQAEHYHQEIESEENLEHSNITFRVYFWVHKDQGKSNNSVSHTDFTWPNILTVTKSTFDNPIYLLSDRTMPSAVS